ncbi:MAG: NADH-quinone oxidoreductase subunit K [Planctomycetota bacterium]|jgi:multicomponent Na+:H+ antiporter subunit C
MATLIILLIAILFTTAIIAMMRGHLLALIIGICLLSHAVNLSVFISAPPVSGQPPLIAANASAPPADAADPLPQALVLTAIVIGFGVLGFALALGQRLVSASGSPELAALPRTDDLPSTASDGGQP